MTEQERVNLAYQLIVNAMKLIPCSNKRERLQLRHDLSRARHLLCPLADPDVVFDEPAPEEFSRER